MRPRRERPVCVKCDRYMRIVHAPQKYGEVWNCAECGNCMQLERGVLVRTAICELILQTGVGKGGRILKPHQAALPL